MKILLILLLFILYIIIMMIYVIKSIKKLKQNNERFYVARDKGSDIIWLYLGKPIRDRVDNCWIPNHRSICTDYHFEYIGLNKENYKDLKWEDEPVEVFLNLED